MLARYTRQWRTLQWPPKLYVGVSSISFGFQMLAAIALGFIPDYCDEQTLCPREVTVNKISLIVLFAFFQIWNVLDGIFNDNLYELYGAMITSVLMTCLGIAKFATDAHRSWIDWILLIEELVFQVFNVALAYPIYTEYSWRLSKKLGVDSSVRNLFQSYLIAMTLNKFQLMFTILAVVSSGDGCGRNHIFNSGTDLILDITSLIVALIVAVLCWQGHRREKKLLLAIFFILALWHPGYCIYWFTRLSFGADTKKTLLAAIFTLSAIVSLILRVGQFACDYVLIRNMGKGLITILRRHERGRLTRATIAGNDVDNLGADDLEIDFEDEELNIDDVITNTYTSQARDSTPYVSLDN